MVTTRDSTARLSLVMPDPALMPPTSAAGGPASSAQEHLARLDWRQLQLDGPQALDAVLPVELQVRWCSAALQPQLCAGAWCLHWIAGSLAVTCTCC